MCEVNQEKGVTGRTCGTIHERSLFHCDVCGDALWKKGVPEEHLVLFMKGFGSSVISVGSNAEVETTLENI